jgi:hypothetical protein
MATIKVKLSNQYVTSGVAGSVVPETWVMPPNLRPQAYAYSPDYGKGVGFVIPYFNSAMGVNAYTWFAVCFNHNEIAGISEKHYKDYIDWISDALGTGPTVPGCSTDYRAHVLGKLGNSTKDLAGNLYKYSAARAASNLNQLIASGDKDFILDFVYQLSLNPYEVKGVNGIGGAIPGSTFPTKKARKWLNSSDIQGSDAPVPFDSAAGNGDGATGPSMITAFMIDGTTDFPETPLSAAGAYNYSKYSGSSMNAFWSFSHAASNGVPDAGAAESQIADVIDVSEENCWVEQVDAAKTYKFTVCCADSLGTLNRLGFQSKVYIPADIAHDPKCGLTWSIPADEYYPALGAAGGTGFDAMCGNVSVCYEKIGLEDVPATPDYATYATLQESCCLESNICQDDGSPDNPAVCNNVKWELCDGATWTGINPIILPGVCSDTPYSPSVLQIKNTSNDEVACFLWNSQVSDPASDLTNLQLIAQAQEDCASALCGSSSSKKKKK